MNREIETYSPSVIKRTLLKQYGDIPNINRNQTPEEITTKSLESVSFYYLNLIKSDKKEELFKSINLNERVNW